MTHNREEELYTEQEIPLDSPVPQKKKRILLWVSLAFLGVFVGYWVYQLYFKPDNFIRQIYLVPGDAVYLIETDDPIRGWEQFTQSNLWDLVKGHKEMKDLEGTIHTFDSIVSSNRTLLGLLGKRNIIISAHMIRKSDYDFLIIADLQKSSKVESVKGQIENVFKGLGYRVTSRKFNEEKILELFDESDRSTLYMSFIDNHIVCSYTALLLEKSIQEKALPTLGRNLDFLEVEQSLNKKGLCNIYINYKYLNDYLAMYMSPDNDMKDMLNSLNFMGVTLDIKKDKLSLTGYANVDSEKSDSYIPALFKSGKNKITATRILSDRTAFFLTMSFSSMSTFINNIEEVLKKDTESYNAYDKNIKRIENFLKINIKENFFSWMDGEVTFAQNTPGILGSDNEFVAVIKMKDKEQAVKNLEYVAERIRKRTPGKFRTIEYEGYQIHFMEIKGLFKLMFGKLFARLEKPYYTIIDDYVVFSNSTATLLSLIEDNIQGNTLDKDNNFNSFIKDFDDKSTVLAYTNTHKFFPLWKEFVSAETWKDLQYNKEYVYSFPQTAFQLIGNDVTFDTRLISSFEKYVAPEVLDVVSEADFMERNDTIKGVALFFLEKFQGNIHTEHYKRGVVKSETEMHKGKKHGRHRSFHPNGIMAAYGRFRDNRKHGLWKYYDENEKLTRKEKWRNGVVD